MVQPQILLSRSLFSFFGSFLLGFGSWYAHYGDGPVGWGLLLWVIGGVGITASVAVFGLRCCQNA